jgi:hypothetical protein
MAEFMKETEIEIKARKSLIKHLDENYKTCIDEALWEAEGYAIIKCSYREARYSLLEKAYQVYLHCSGNQKAKKYLYKKADELEIKRTKASHLSIIVVKMLFDFSDKNKSLYQYAKALRCASLEKILPAALAETLATKGNGIAQMATRFAEKVPMKPRAPASKSSAAKPQSRHAPENSETLDEAEEADAADDDDVSDSAGSEDSDELEDAGPSFSWDPAALEDWESADIGTRVLMTATKRDADDGLITKAHQIEK